MAPFDRRRNITSNNRGDRIVTVGGMGAGGLNERFGRLDQQQSRPVGRNNHQQHNNNNNNSVFSRLHGNNHNNNNHGKSNIQSRLGHVSIQNRLGVQKKHGNKQAAVTKRSAPTNKFINKKSSPAFGKNNNNKHHQQQQKSKFIQKGGKTMNKKNLKQQQKSKKPVTAESLDKALDSYMMKDPKTAQAKLDDELNSYMDDAPVDDELIGLS